MVVKEASLKDPIVYIRYRNKSIPGSVEQETLGWLRTKIGNTLYIEHNRTIETPETFSGSGNGIWINESKIIKKILLNVKGSKQYWNLFLLFRVLNAVAKEPGRTVRVTHAMEACNGICVKNVESDLVKKV